MLESYLDNSKIEYQKNVDLKKKTWIHRGGMCDIFILPNGKSQLYDVVNYLYKNDIEFVLLGHTSNTYILNTCNLTVIVSTLKCNHYELANDYIYCEAGVGVTKLANAMVRNGIAGFEYLTDLPGTVGSAIYNNSSCRSNSISKLLVTVEVLTREGNIETYGQDELKFNYRSSAFKEKTIDGTILSAVLKVEMGDQMSLMKIAADNQIERRNLLEHRSKTLGSTVNKCFDNGPMPKRYYIPFKIYNLWLKITDKDACSRQHKSKEFICSVAGYRRIAKYISDQDVIIFNWLDEDADDAFPLYLEFMRRVYQTDIIEIEILK